MVEQGDEDEEVEEEAEEEKEEEKEDLNSHIFFNMGSIAMDSDK